MSESVCILSKVTHGGQVVQDPHAVSVYESFSANLNVSDVPEADQQPFADQRVAVSRVIAMPVLVQR